jgi:small membrane protein
MLKIILIAFIAFAFSRALLRFKDKSISVREFIFWSVLWASATVLILNPRISDIAATSFGIGRGADVAFFLSILILFYSVFRLYVKIDELDKHLTNLTVATSKALKKKDTL